MNEETSPPAKPSKARRRPPPGTAWLTAILMILATGLSIFALVATDQGRDLLMLSQDQGAAFVLFMGLTITSVVTTFLVSWVIGGPVRGDLFDNLGRYAMLLGAAIGMGIFAGWVSGSFLIGIGTYLSGAFAGILFCHVATVSLQHRPRATLLGLGGLSICCLLVVAKWPGEIGQKLGAPLLLTLLCLAWLLLLFAFSGIRFGGNFPRALKIVAVVVGSWWLLRSVYVAVQTLASGHPHLEYVRHAGLVTPGALPTLHSAYDSWHKREKVAQRVTGKPDKPQLVLIAAAGGGIRASYWTSLLLTRLADRAPDLHSKLFASSGVSGGSLGLGLFYALLDRDKKVDCAADDKSRERCVKIFHDRDFLAGPLGATIAGYPANALLPVFEGRNNALEIAWERAWRRTVGETGPLADRFALPMRELWTDAAIQPLLLLNTTSVISGERALAGNVQTDWIEARARCRFNLVDEVDLPLSAAIGASARFPLLSDWGWLQRPRAENCAALEGVADGGFYDNYGAATLLDLIDRLQKADPDFSANVELIVIQITSDPSREMGCLFKGLSVDRAQNASAAVDYCLPKPKPVAQKKEQPEPMKQLAGTGTPSVPYFNQLEPSPALEEFLGSVSSAFRSALLGVGGPSVLDVAMRVRAVNGIGIAERLRAKTCALNGSYYHFAMTGSEAIPLGWTISTTAQARLSALLDDNGTNKPLFDRLAKELNERTKQGQC
jgi:MFS family permease